MQSSSFESTPSDDSQAQGQDDLTGAIIKLLRQGKKIEAIQLYMKKNGTGLKEAKDAVDALEPGIHK